LGRVSGLPRPLPVPFKEAVMPLYNYECRRHGSFREWRSMSDSEKPMPCPGCDKPARRTISSPRLGMDATTRKAHATNERSAHEPCIVRKRAGDPIPPHDAHRDLTQAHNHGHNHDHGKIKRSNHPWMIRH